MFENKNIQGLAPYVPTSQAPWHMQRGIDCAKLDWNEGTFVPEFIKTKAKALVADERIFNWYPDIECSELTEKLAAGFDLSFQNILVYPGSDVALDEICRTFIDPGDAFLQLVPTYGNFRVFAEAAGCQAIDFEFFEHSPEAIARLFDAISKAAPKLVYIVSPNNPCGYSISVEAIAELCSSFPATLFVVDQAYVEFDMLVDVSALAKSHSNFIATRTFSKAYGLAGLRIGYTIGSSEILKSLRKIRNGKNISAFAQKLALVWLQHPKELQKWTDEIQQNRSAVCELVEQKGWRYFNSCANFVTFFPDDPKGLIRDCVTNGVFVRSLQHTVPGAVRVTIGDKRANSMFLNCLS